MFDANQKIICIDKINVYHGELCPKVGKIYTVRANTLVRGTPYVYLNEIINPDGWYEDIGFKEPLFPSNKFRPLEDWENQDISELTEVIKNPRLTPTTYQIID